MKKFILIILAMLIAVPVYAKELVKVIQLHYKTVDQVLPLLTPVLADGAKASGQGSTLVIKTTADNLTQIRYLLHKIDVPPTQFLIAIRQGNQHSNTTNLGNVIEYNTQSNSYQLQTQQVKVMAGETAFIKTGQQVPVIESAGYGWWTGVAYQRRNVSQGFWVEPTRQGSQVLLKIYRLRERIGRTTQQNIDYQKMMTTLRVPLNKWVALGATRSNGGLNQSNVIVYQTGDRYKQTSDLFIKVSIIDDINNLPATK